MPPAREANRYAPTWNATVFEGHESAQIAAHSTRDKKQILSPAEVFAAHRRLAAEFGNQANHVVAEARARAVSAPARPAS